MARLLNVPHPAKLLLALLLAGAPASLLAQSGAQPGITQRVDRIEKELRAVQRKVFPGAGQAPGYLEPELTAPPPPQGAGSAAPLTDLTARVGSLEQELARMTGQIEQNGFRLKQFEDQLARLRSEADSRLVALEGTPAGATPTEGNAGRPPATTRPPATRAPDDEPPARADDSVPVAPPPSADPGEEAYLAGYRLWAAKNYPAAESMLKDFVARYPKHKRVSYGQNLLGRTYLDSGRPAAAAVAFHKNYTTMPRGDRAPDSLYFLGQSLMKLDKPNPGKACEAYEALLREYGDKIGADLKAKVARGQVDAKCKVDG